ncbi:MAG: DNA polymerase III subunit delta' [Nitrospina sp.]|nr:DNA polymerase III subunit delta' [Nitrospina sp.]
MSFENILGQDLPKQTLNKALRSGRIPNAYLFHGQKSVGKKFTAIEVGKALNCKTLGPVNSCDKCASCIKIEKRIHPDLFIIEPKKSSPTSREAILKIDEVRELQKKLLYLPYEGKTKVAIINNAECMNPQAANSFLKTLEEPPSKTLIILIASNLYQLLPTVVSRCQGIRFHPLPTQAIKTIIRNHLESEGSDTQPEEIELRSRRSMGQVVCALGTDLLEILNEREELIRLVSLVSFKRMDQVFPWTKAKSKQTEHIQLILDELMRILRDTVLIKIDPETSAVINTDLTKQLKKLSLQKSTPALLKMFETVQVTKVAIKLNANSQLALENMLISFCEAA